MNYFWVGRVFVCCTLLLLRTTPSYGASLHDSIIFSFSEKLPLSRDNQIDNAYQVSSFFIDAKDAEEFDQVKITRFSNDDYLATYFLKNEVRYRAHYQSMHQKVILITHNSFHSTLDEIIQDKRNIEIQLDYTLYDPLNVHFNVARIVNAGFIRHLKQAMYCAGQPVEKCSTGYITKTGKYSSYQPYTLNPVSRVAMEEEPDKSTRIIMDGEEVFISYNGNGSYRRTRAMGRQHANQKHPPAQQTDSQPSTSNTATISAGKDISGSTTSGRLSSSGDDNDDDDDPDKRQRHDKKKPDDYQEAPSGTPPNQLSRIQLMEYMRFINAGLQYQIDKVVTPDPIVIDMLRQWADQPEELALALRSYLRNRFGVSQAELAELENEMNRVIEQSFSTFAYEYRNCKESYYCTSLLNAYLAELQRDRPNLSEQQLIILSDLLTQTFSQIIAFNRIDELSQLISQYGFCLPHRLKEIKSSGGCWGGSCALANYCSGERIANGVRTVFGTHSAVMAFSTLILSYLYYNYGEYFNPDVEVDELLVLMMSGFSTGASLVASFLNTTSLYMLLNMAPCFSMGEKMVLGGLNTLKDVFTILGLIFGMMLPDQPQNLRLCQVLNGIFGAAFPVYLLHSIRKLYCSQSNDGQIANPEPFLQRRETRFLSVFALLTAAAYGGTHVLGALSGCQPDQSTFFTTGITSAWCNLAFPEDALYSEIVRFGSYMATVFVGITLLEQHAIIREITSQTNPAFSQQLQQVNAMRQPLNIRALISVLTLLGSFVDRFHINPLSFWWIPLLDTGKSIFFEAAVQELRERVIASNIHKLKTDELKQAFNEAVKLVEILPGMTMGEYIEELYRQFDKACIRTKRNSSNWVRHYAEFNKFEALLKLRSVNDNEETHVIRAGSQKEHFYIHTDQNIFIPPDISDTAEPHSACNCNGACNCATFQQNGENIPLLPSAYEPPERESTGTHEETPATSRFTIEPVVIKPANETNTGSSEDETQPPPKQTNKED